MKDLIRLLAKEVRRIRALIELMKDYDGSPARILYREAELGQLKRILAMAIKNA